MALSGATTPGQSGSGSIDNEGLLRISESPRTTGTAGLFRVISRTLIRGWGSYPSTEVHSVYSTAPADWANRIIAVRNT